MATPKVQMTYTWTLSLNPDDTRLVLAGLGGRLRGEDVEKARELGDRMTRERAAQSSHLAEQMRKHVENIGS